MQYQYSKVMLEREIFNYILLIEESFLHDEYVRMNKRFDKDLALSDMKKYHNKLKNIFIIYDRRKNSIKSYMRYRINSKDTILITSLYINKENYPISGFRQLVRIIHYGFNHLPQKKIISEVYKTNIASIRLHLKLGFIISSETIEKLHYVIEKSIFIKNIEYLI